MPALSALSLNGLPTTSSGKNSEETKKFTCKKCKASFSQSETFKRHMNFYCKEENTAQNEGTTQNPSSMTPNQSSTATPNLAEILAALQQQNRRQNSLQHSLLDPNAFTSNTVILPVAYHHSLDQALIQIVGPPQTIIPVSIGRNIPPICKPLLLDGSLVNSLRLPPAGRIPLNTSGITDFGLPLAFIQPFASTLPFLNGQLAQNRQFIPQPASSSATATATITSMNALSPSLICAANKQRTRSALSTANPTPRKRRRISVDKPLDLSKNSRSDESVISSSSPPLSETMENETEKSNNKRFICECGVSFLSIDTLTSHRKYYCRNRIVDEEEERELIRKVPSRCSQCDYVPTTHAQLAQHVRHKHCTVQAYVCLLCGYKGYSARGIKNHLRNSHADEMSKRKSNLNGDEKSASNVLSDKSLLQDYVFCVTDKTQQMACTKCRSTFPTDDLLKRHNCPARTDDDKI